jgi:hypothetical protein
MVRPPQIAKMRHLRNELSVTKYTVGTQVGPNVRARRRLLGLRIAGIGNLQERQGLRISEAESYKVESIPLR